jgi:hypothetical protein
MVPVKPVTCFRDFLQRLADGARLVSFRRDIAERDNANESLVAIQYR